MSTEQPPARICTHTGREFWPLDPRPDSIVPEDVAHALSMKCRYAGHVNDFYSVAEHCVRLSDFFISHSHGDVNLARWALLHDASEAYLPDVPSPIKPHLPGFKEMEARVTLAVAWRFTLPLPEPLVVMEMDKCMISAERAQLWGNLDEPPAWWGAVPEDATLNKYMANQHLGWVPGRAEAEWLQRFEQLAYRGAFL